MKIARRLVSSSDPMEAAVGIGDWKERGAIGAGGAHDRAVE